MMNKIEKALITFSEPGVSLEPHVQLKQSNQQLRVLFLKIRSPHLYLGFLLYHSIHRASCLWQLKCRQELQALATLDEHKAE